MPSTDPFKTLIRQAIRQELLRGDDPGTPRVPGRRQRFVKTAMVNGVLTNTEGELPDAMEDMADAFAEAIARVIRSLKVVSTTIPLPVSVMSVPPGPPGIPSTGFTTPIPSTPILPNIVITPPLAPPA